MKKLLATIGMGLMIAGGCAGGGAPPLETYENSKWQADVPAEPDESASSALDTEVVATVNGRPISLRQLHEPLLEAHGLPILLHVVQLELAKQKAEEAGVDVTDEDVAAERAMTIEQMFEQVEDEDPEALLAQFLQQQNVSRAEFEILVKTNAHLRQTARPMLEGRITEAHVREAFGALYGETVQVRHIQLANMQEIAEARGRLDEGEAFEDVARALSRNSRTAAAGGELPAFSRAMTDLPESFRDIAFSLEEGEVSDPVHAEGAYHLIKLEKRNAPRAVRFEDVRESLRDDLYERWVQATTTQLRAQIGQEALMSLEIADPILREQFAKQMEQRQAQIRDREELARELERQREEAAAEQAFE